jgi:hypothetical protein
MLFAALTVASLRGDTSDVLGIRQDSGNIRIPGKRIQDFSGNLVEDATIGPEPATDSKFEGLGFIQFDLLMNAGTDALLNGAAVHLNTFGCAYFREEGSSGAISDVVSMIVKHTSGALSPERVTVTLSMYSGESQSDCPATPLNGFAYAEVDGSPVDVTGDLFDFPTSPGGQTLGVIPGEYPFRVWASSDVDTPPTQASSIPETGDILTLLVFLACILLYVSCCANQR